MNAWDGSGEGDAITDPPQRGWYFTCDEPRAGEPDALPRCARYGQPGCFFADLQNTLTHEVGHLLGLRHVCDAGGGGTDADLPPCDTPDAGYPAITMYPLTAPGDVEKRTLHADDVAGVCAVYPASDAGGGCGCGAGGAPGAIAALLAAAALRPRRRRPPGAARRGAQATSTPA
jgi:MYXO-CTERM domain-containing protein